MSSAICVNFDQSKILLSVNGLNVDKMMDSVFDGLKSLWEKEKMLLTSTISFSHNVSEDFFH